MLAGAWSRKTIADARGTTDARVFNINVNLSSTLPHCIHQLYAYGLSARESLFRLQALVSHSRTCLSTPSDKLVVDIVVQRFPSHSCHSGEPSRSPHELLPCLGLCQLSTGLQLDLQEITRAHHGAQDYNFALAP